MSETYRFLCCGDNHGDAESLRRVGEDTAGEEFDYVVHTGDLTNLFFDGYPTAEKQLTEITPHLETLADRGEFVYVFGNRDGRGLDRFKPSDLPVGTHVPEEGLVKVGDLAFAQLAPPSDAVESPVVRVTHYWKATPPRFDGLLSLSGDTHNGRSIGNIVDTSFLYRTSNHGADAVYGGYYVVEADTDGAVDVEFRPVGSVEEHDCPRHSLLGERFVTPSFWKKSCPFCYDEDDYYNELRQAVLSLYVSENDVDWTSGEDPVITEELVDTVEDNFPRPFRTSERATLVTDDADNGEQTGLDAF